MDFLACREKGHHWRHLTDKAILGPRKRVVEVSRFWRCAGCDTEMNEVIELPSCEVKTRKYLYPDGYLLEKGLEPMNGRRVGVRDVRREVFGRIGIKV